MSVIRRADAVVDRGSPQAVARLGPFEDRLYSDSGEAILSPGDACCWPKGVANGHQVVNRSAAPCSFLVVGIRAPADRVHYSELDKLYVRRADGSESRTRRDGSPLEAP
jgi:uncharacterized cupin superfamily protein